MPTPTHDQTTHPRGYVRDDVRFAAPPGLHVEEPQRTPARGRVELRPVVTTENEADRSWTIAIATHVPGLTAGLTAWMDRPDAGWRVVAACDGAGELARALADIDADILLVSDAVAADAATSPMGALPARTRVIVLVLGHLTPQIEVALVRAGASTVVPGSLNRDRLVRAVAELLDGRATVSADALRLAATGDDGPELTRRQREVLELLATGQSTSQIAERLAVAPSTVKSHVRDIQERVGVTGHRALVASARELLALDAAPIGAPPVR